MLHLCVNLVIVTSLAWEVIALAGPRGRYTRKVAIRGCVNVWWRLLRLR